MFSRNALRKALYVLTHQYLHSGERVNPDFPDENFYNHLRVYQFARQFVTRESRVLDVGCGTGYGSAYLAETAVGVTGFDISKAAVRLARRKYSRPRFYVMDAQKLGFPDASFDFIISTENFEHLRDQRGHLVELRRVLRPGGLLLIGTPNPEMFEGYHNPYHTKENTFQELTELLRPIFDEFAILENQLPHNLDRVRGVLPTTEPLIVLGRTIDKTYLSNTHSFLCFCR